MKISVFGTGYVGLVQGAVLADAGHQVTCVDLDEKKLQDLREGVIPIFEPGLDSIRRPPSFSSTGLWSPGVNLTVFE